MDEPGEEEFQTHLTTPVGGDLTERELRSIELYYSLEPGILARGTRTGQRDVTVTKRVEALQEIKLTVVI